ncbi:MAG TPA: alpha/beta hydrolase [Thermoanaerobaculia bacterium]|nr:alpha/beta hydrolase [Thermoanaerobaculia bacterium]
MRNQIRLALAAVLTASALYAAPAKFEPFKFKANDGTIVDAERGEFRVRENRSKPGSRMLTLRFIRFKSTATNPGPPIVYLAGGPGGAGTGAATGSRFGMFMAFREFGDVIAYDARGVHESEPNARCTEEFLVNPSEPLDRTKYGAALADAMRLCADRLRKQGYDPGSLNVREYAADLNDLRDALGAKKLILWGISYGAHVAIATLRYHPDAIERVILAGIEGPDDTYKLPSDQQSLMEDIARLAHKDGKSVDLLGSITKLLNELEARPKSAELVHPETGQKTTFVVGKLDLQRELAGMLFAPDTFAVMPDFVARLEQGDWLSLALAAAPGRFGTPPTMMQIAMDCAAGITAARRQRIAEEAKWTLLGDAINVPFPEICQGLDIPDVGDAYRAPLVSDVPALLISGTLDGRTRPRQMEELRRTMPNAIALTIEGAGHSDPLFLSTPKLLETMKMFLRGELIRERVFTLPPVEFQAPRKIANVPMTSSHATPAAISSTSSRSGSTRPARCFT